MIQKYFKRDPNVNRDSNAFKNNVLLIDLSRGVSLKRSLRLVTERRGEQCAKFKSEYTKEGDVCFAIKFFGL